MSTLVVGLGSAHGDDRAGWLVAERLLDGTAGAGDGAAPSAPAREVTVRRAGSPFDLLDWLDGVERLVICDATEPAGRPGRCRRWRWPEPELGSFRCTGSHDVTLASVLGLAETLGRLPDQVVVFGVEAGGSVAPGCLTPAVEAAVTELANLVRAACLAP